MDTARTLLRSRAARTALLGLAIALLAAACASGSGDRSTSAAAEAPVSTRSQPAAPAEIRPSHVLEGHLEAVTRLAWSPDGRVLASGSEDRSVRLWELRDVSGPSG